MITEATALYVTNYQTLSLMLKTWKKMFFNMKKGDRWVINKVHKNQYKVIWEAASTEMDNNADTHLFGENFCPISFTSK